jgi:hypothetical protein
MSYRINTALSAHTREYPDRVSSVVFGLHPVPQTIGYAELRRFAIIIRLFRSDDDLQSVCWWSHMEAVFRWGAKR